MNGGMAASLILLSAFLFGFMGIHTRELYDVGFNSYTVAFFRLFVTVVILGVFILAFRRKWLVIKKEHLMLFLLLGFTKGFMDVMLIITQKYVTLGFATSLQMTAPFFVIVISFLVFGEKITHRGVAATLLCIVGTILYSGVLFDEDPISIKGVTRGLLCGLATAVCMILTKSLLEKGYNPTTVVFYMFLIGLFCVIPFVNVPAAFDLASSPGALYNILMLGLFCTTIPFLLTAIGQKYLDTLRATIFTTFEIAAAAAVGIIFYDEFLDYTNVIGIVLIISSIVLMVPPKDSGKGAASS